MIQTIDKNRTKDSQTTTLNTTFVSGERVDFLELPTVVNLPSIILFL